MELLCKTNARLDYEDIWKKFIKQGENISEWYGDYPALCSILHKYIKPTDRTLVIGSTNVTISESLYDDGYHSLVNVDSNETSLETIASMNEANRPDMTFISMEMAKMTFDDDSFSAALDKGTLDALMHDDSRDVLKQATLLFGQIRRILKLGGRYLCVSLAQEHVAMSLMDYFSNEGWPVRVHKLVDMKHNDRDNQETFQPPVFVFVCTKFKKMPQVTKKILEVCLDKDNTIRRLESTEEIGAVIQERQQYAMFRHHIQHGCMDEGVSVVLLNSATNQPRYTLHIVDSSESKRARWKFAIFIVPQGRENEWLFATDPGRSVLSKQAGFQRLLVACLHRDNSYESIDDIKEELSSKVMELAPPGLDTRLKVPFLTIGDDLGYREVRYRGTSEYSGSFVVEDVRSEDGSMHRQLVFLSSGDAVQSEIRIIPEKPKKKKRGKTKEPAGIQLDYSYMATDYQRFLVAGLATIPQFQRLLEDRLYILLIGLGGGILPMFIYKHFPNAYLDVVDLDPAIVDVAKNWFGCVEDRRMCLRVEDGVKFITHSASHASNHQYHSVIFDVDCKDHSVGMSCPPRPFVEVKFLKLVKDLILHPQGVFQINIVARNKALKEEVIQDIKSVFPTVLRRKIEDHLNEIVYAFPEKSLLSDEELKQSLRIAGLEIQQIASSATTPLDPDTDLSEVLQNLEIQ